MICYLGTDATGNVDDHDEDRPSPSVRLYVPPDIDASSEAWGANCGPCSLAALLGKPVSEVRALFVDFDRKRYVNPTQMKAALALATAKFTAIGPRWPGRGLVFVQFRGSWDSQSVFVQYRHTHWITVNGPAVFDVNAGHWVSRSDWEDPENGVAAWIASNTPGATGPWFVRSGIEVPS